MYAVIEDRNQQYRVSPGDRIQIAHNAALEAGASVTFDKVCLVGGDVPQVGQPFVDGATVTGKVVGDVKGPKLIVAKFRRRKNSRSRVGFRAQYTEVQIEAVNA